MNTFLPTKIHNILLRQQRVVFYLVYCGHDGSVGEQLGQVFYGVVCYADCAEFGMGALEEGFEGSPGGEVGC